MSTLRDYLAQKRRIWLAKQETISTAEPITPTAKVTAEGRSGVRRIRIRDHQVLSDSGADYAGYDLGPSSPELQLGVLGSCVTHIFLIQAAAADVVLDSVEVEVTATIDPKAGTPGFEDVPPSPQNISYTVHIGSPATDGEIDALFEAVERACPILSLLTNPQTITGSVVRVPAQREESAL
ncbi:OsmC family protein [Actinokineospora globicatena]|uniref:Osmotically inducible protein OsmC n=1 Tax=Actinokineospora globicatena TaxID=103729 RepID=A0A9W6QKW2_9PSEU|nr:OsmC family protein [Actinokineospora globicatena]GLW90520.1 osmotically inducible protein OsmC [Actinokineospora globicatena]